MTHQQQRNATHTSTGVANLASAKVCCSIATRTQPHTATAGTSHSFITHQLEDGVDQLFVQQQVGHRWGSSTAGYTKVGSDYLQAAGNDRLIWPHLGHL